MIRLKGGDNKEANYMADKMGKALGGVLGNGNGGPVSASGPKKKLWGQDEYQIKQGPYKQVSIKSGASAVEGGSYNSGGPSIGGGSKFGYETAGPAPLLDAREELKPRGEDDADSDFEFSDDDAALERIRAARSMQLRKQGGIVQQYRAQGHGSYTTVTQDGFLPAVTESKYAVCHIFHADFERCKIVDKHLSLLAPKYLPVRFISLDAAKAPFFVEKLRVQMLPTIVLFKDGIAVDRVTGFEELGGTDEFTTKDLETRLKQKGVLRSLSREGEEREGDSEDEAERAAKAAIRQSQHAEVAEDDDDDY